MKVLDLFLPFEKGFSGTVLSVQLFGNIFLLILWAIVRSLSLIKLGVHHFSYAGLVNFLLSTCRFMLFQSLSVLW